MNCPSCSRENPDDASFCGGCGESLAREIECRGCGRQNPPSQKFCHGCGAPLADAAAEAPRRGLEAAAPAAAPSSFASGRYRVKRLIGEGAKKRVYLARDQRLDRDVA